MLSVHYRGTTYVPPASYHHIIFFTAVPDGIRIAVLNLVLARISTENVYLVPRASTGTCIFLGGYEVCILNTNLVNPGPGSIPVDLHL
eukprot:SAG11_NODE_11826_length_736_cov_1.345369_1_plen_87_part_01